MATANRTLGPVAAPRVESTSGDGRAAPPRLLRCLVVSSEPSRRRLIRSAAEQQAWDAIVCRDAGEFLRVAFKRSVPLVVVDLPKEDACEYWALRDATEQVKRATDALVLIAGADSVHSQEIWARKLGAWTYLSEANSQRGFELVFSEAREALARSGAGDARPLAPADAEGW